MECPPSGPSICFMTFVLSRTSSVALANRHLRKSDDVKSRLDRLLYDLSIYKKHKKLSIHTNADGQTGWNDGAEILAAPYRERGGDRCTQKAARFRASLGPFGNNEHSC